MHAPFSRIREVLARGRRAAARWLPGRPGGLVAAARSGRARVLLPPVRPARHADGSRTRARPPPSTCSRVGEAELTGVLRELGEERYARRIARAIVEARGQEDLSTTGALAALVARSVPRREHHKDPATRTFQALRMAVNRELPELERLLADVPGVPAAGRAAGRDRLSLARGPPGQAPAARAGDPAAQRAGRARGDAGLAGCSPRSRSRPRDAELADNPRARSAKLRVAERCAS